jgi:hypothetical protein
MAQATRRRTDGWPGGEERPSARASLTAPRAQAWPVGERSAWISEEDAVGIDVRPAERRRPRRLLAHASRSLSAAASGSPRADRDGAEGPGSSSRRTRATSPRAPWRGPEQPSIDPSARRVPRRCSRTEASADPLLRMSGHGPRVTERAQRPGRLATDGGFLDPQRLASGPVARGSRSAERPHGPALEPGFSDLSTRRERRDRPSRERAERPGGAATRDPDGRTQSVRPRKLARPMARAAAAVCRVSCQRRGRPSCDCSHRRLADGRRVVHRATSGIDRIGRVPDAGSRWRRCMRPGPRM